MTEGTNREPTFPDPAAWIPRPDILNDVGEGLLAVAVGALTVHGLGERYERRYVGHGTEAPVVPSKAKQLTVVCTKVYVGKAGEEQFQFARGAPGIIAFQTGQFMVEMSAPWPVPTKGGTHPALTPTTELDASRAMLWREGFIVWAAMIGVVLGGVGRPWERDGEPAGDVAVGPMVPKEPAGGQASWTFQVQVQF